MKKMQNKTESKKQIEDARMSDENMQDYKEVYDNLKAPEQWKTEIKALMREELKKNENEKMDSEQSDGEKATDEHGVIGFEKRRKSFGIYRNLLLVGGIAAALFLIVTIYPINGPKFVTPMKDDDVQAVVALKDTELHFEIQNDAQQDVAVMAGKDGTDGNGVHFEVNDETGEIVTDGKAQDAGVEPSIIKGIPVCLTVTETENGYQYTAAYEKDGEKCELTRSGVTQKEFIKLLYKEIK